MRAIDTAASDLRSALAMGLPVGYVLRERTQGDLTFLCKLYASTREDELRPVNWTDEQKSAFLQDQFEKQHLHYLAHYPRAQWLVIEHDALPVGRIYLEQMPSEIRLMDVALMPSVRGQGLGTALMHALIAHADLEGLAISLHVEPYNPAMRLYRRLGFIEVEARGYYLFMERRGGKKAN